MSREKATYSFLVFLMGFSFAGMLMNLETKWLRILFVVVFFLCGSAIGIGSYLREKKQMLKERFFARL